MNTYSTVQRTHRSFLSGIASTGFFGTQALVRFLVAPFIVSSIGMTHYGIWEVCRQLLVQMEAVEGRSMQALKWTLANKQGSTDVSAKRRDVGSAIQVWACFVPLILLVGILLIWKGPYFLGETSPETFPIVRLTIALLVLNFALSAFMKLPQAILIGENLEYKAIHVEILTMILGNGGFIVLAIFLGFGIIGLAAATMLTTLLTGLLLFWISRQNVSWFGLEWPPFEHLRSFFKFSAWVLSWTFVNKLIMSTDLIILGYISSPEIVSGYVLTLFLISPGVQIAARLTQAAIPGLGGVVGEKNFNLARRVRAEIMVVSWILVTVLGCLVIAWNRSFVFNWMGPSVYVGDVVNLLMVLMIAQQIIYRNDAFIIDTTLSLQKKVAFGIGAALATNGLGLILGLQYGMVGLLIGLIGGRAILSIAFPILVATAFHARPVEQFAWAIRPILIMSIIWGIAWSVRDRLFVDDWIGLIAGALCTALAAGVVAVFSGLDSMQRQQFFFRLSLFRKLIPA